MRYEECPPVPALAPFVQCLWTLSGDAADLAGQDQAILPDGRPELILHFGDAFERVSAAGPSERQPALMLAGQLTAQITLRPTGRIRVLGVRFHPFGAASCGVGAMHELSGLTADLAGVSPALARALAAVRSATDDPRRAIDLVQRALLRVVDPARVDERVRFAVSAIGRRRGQVSIDGLAREASWTRRHLERRFLAAVGVGPKRLARIMRFQHALRLLEHADPVRPGTATAASCGYADQAHFIRDFRDLAGCAPGEYLLTKGQLTGFFTQKASDDIGPMST